MVSSPIPASHSRVLFVIAHPDDEAMFFSPTILILNKSNNHKHNSYGKIDNTQNPLLHLICLSVGNNDGLGTVREKELYKSCKVLGIPEERVKIFNEKGLQDGFNNEWDHELIMDIVRRTVDEFHIDTV